MNKHEAFLRREALNEEFLKRGNHATKRFQKELSNSIETYFRENRMSWLSDYLVYTSNQESPERFHMWAGIALCAAALGRRVWMDRRERGVTYYKVYPGQLQIILIGKSGRVKKNGAITPAKRLAKKIDLNVIEGRMSAERFLEQLDPKKRMNNNPGTGFLCESELSVLISKATYAESIIDILTRMADDEKEFPWDTRSGGRIVIPDPCITVLAATTPVSLGESLPEKAHGAGYSSRVIFVYESSTSRVHDLTDCEDDDISMADTTIANDVAQRLEDELRRISKLCGPATFTKSGRLWFQDFYRRWVNSPEGQEEGWPTRRPDHMLRVAITLTAAKQDILAIDDMTLMAVDAMLQQVELDLPQVFMYVGTKNTRNRERLLRALALGGGSLTSDVLFNKVHYYFYDQEELRKTLELLRISQIIDVNTIQLSSGGLQEVWSLRRP